MTDKQRVDKMAHLRIVDGLGGLDIDEMTLAVHGVSPAQDDSSEESWRLEWRKQFRKAVDMWNGEL